jgi:endonuclease YncB( thermonuclease family)
MIELLENYKGNTMYQYKIRKIIDIIDGDTLKVELSLGFYIYHEITLRLVDINAPEVRTINEEVKKYGIRAKEKLQEYINGGDGNLIISTLKPKSEDKYGRILGTLYKEGQNLTASEYMLANSYAWYYSDKVKETDLTKLAPL